MTTINTTLAAAIAAAMGADPTKINYSGTIGAQLGNNRRLRCFRDPNPAAPNPAATGVEFLNMASTGPMPTRSGNIAGFGVLSDVIVRQPADLSTGACALVLEGNGRSITYTLGLKGSGKDFTLSANVTGSPNQGFAFTPGSGMRSPPLLDSGTGPRAPALTANAPHHINIKDGNGVLQGVVPIDVRRLNWVFDDPEVASNMGDVRVYTTSSPVTYGGFEFGVMMWAMTGQANAESSDPVYEVAIVRVPTDDNWPDYPAYSGYKEGITDTFGPAFKAEICTASGTVLYVHQMRDGLPINSDQLHDNHLYDAANFPIRPHMNCAQVLPWRSNRAKRNTFSQKWMPGFKPDSYRNTLCRKHTSTNQALPAYNFRENISGVSNFYLTPKWAQKFEQYWSGYPANLDPYSYDMLARPAVYLNGYGWEPGATGKKDQLTGVGGARDDRMVYNTELAIYLSNPNYVRPTDNATIQDMFDNREKNAFNFPIFQIRDAKTFETIPLDEVEAGLWTYSRGYYASSLNYVSMDRTVPQFVIPSGAGSDQNQPYYGAYVDKNGRMPYGGAGIDQLHNYDEHGLIAPHCNSPMHAWAMKLRFIAAMLSYIGDDGNKNPSGSTHPFQGQLFGAWFLLRLHAWRWQILSNAWKLSSDHAECGIPRALIENRMQRELERIHDDVKVPVIDQNLQTPYAKGLRNMGVPMKALPAADYWVVDHGSQTYYLAGVLQWMRQTGMFNVMYNKSAKCKAAFDFIFRCLDLCAVDFILDTDGRSEFYDVVKGPNGQNADIYSSWAEWAAANPKTHPDQDWVTDGQGRKRYTYTDWDQDITQHLRYQYVCFRRDYFPEIPCARPNGIALAIAKYKSFYDEVTATATANPSRDTDWSFLWPGLSEMLPPATLVPLQA